MERWFAIKLWQRVLLGLVLGAAFGLIISFTMEPVAAESLLSKVRVIGDIFIRLIRMIVVPLVFFTLVAGIYAMGDPKKLGTIGVKAFGLYLATTFFANLIGLAMGTIFRPGANVDLGGAEPRALGDAQS
ncbi:MAG: cation:dicarboxylase symporter family transporter, partial [Pseudomonadota bacterium]